MSQTLISIDYINDIVDEKGKLAAKGYREFADRTGSMERASEAMEAFRKRGDLVVHVRVSFDTDYNDKPDASPLFGKADQFEVLKSGTWGTEFYPDLKPLSGESVVVKNRVCSFHGTKLDSLLQSFGVRNIVLCGVATDLAVEAAARSAHDRDYVVTVLADGCTAANNEDHLNSLKCISKFATVLNLDDLL